MIDRKLLDAARVKFATLDLSAENERLAEDQARLARVSAAIVTAEERMAEIRRLRTVGSLDSEAVAEALLGGFSAMVAARAGPTSDQLAEETDSLRAGMVELNRQARDIRDHAERVGQDASTRAADCARTLVDAIMADMRAAAGRIVEDFAAVAAIHNATRCYFRECGIANRAVEGLGGGDNLLVSPRSVDVPGEIRELLAVLADKGPAIKPMLAPSIARW